jgi:hypothetical protein
MRKHVVKIHQGSRAKGSSGRVYGQMRRVPFQNSKFDTVSSTQYG